MRILAVEDNKNVQQILRETLTPEFDVTVVSKLFEARTYLSLKKFDLIVLDPPKFAPTARLVAPVLFAVLAFFSYIWVSRQARAPR